MRTNLNVHFDERLTVKALGARWDPALKTWYCPDGIDLTPLLPWVPSSKLDMAKLTDKQKQRLLTVLEDAAKSQNHRQQQPRKKRNRRRHARAPAQQAKTNGD